MKCRLNREMGCDPSPDFPTGRKPAGTVIDHPDAWRLVQMGVAVPADGECEEQACMSPHQMRRAAAAYEKVSLGIHPDDYQSFDAGYMRGYNADGSWIPGENYAEWQMQQWEARGFDG